MTSLRPALDAAIAAAREAGVMLLEEFHRPGGPRGPRGTAPIDDEVEVLLRERLGGGFPEWGFRAEERPDEDRRADLVGGSTWLVDPNDGTSAFQAGHRGSSVSIALIREGRPVLGVVYAYAAPDDTGDLMAWAEGCPLTRNGVEISPELPSALRPEHTVLISNAADSRPLANGRVVLPARYRPAPGIAYRLALAAAGEGAAAISLNRPRDFDIAGGHALLRGAGVDLVDERAREVTYKDKPTYLGFCFGGHAEVCGHFRHQDWATALRAPKRSPEALDLAGPRIGALVRGPELGRAQGAWMGQLAGDALGSQVEFRSAEAIARSWPEGVNVLRDGGPFDLLAGQSTDDSELATLLAWSLLEGGDYAPGRAMDNYLKWLPTRPFDVGNTIRAALTGQTNSQSQANGALMRVSPLAIAGAGWDPDRLAEAARADALLTHPHRVCQDANVVYALALAYALREGAGPRAVYDYALEQAGQRGLHPDVRETLKAAASGPPAELMHQMGWVRKALQLAFWQLHREVDFEEGVVDTVSRGGDTDTNGCIAGALLGAVHGLSAVPAQWVDRVRTCRPQEGLPGVRRPRPLVFWPCDALVMAERLRALS